MDEHLALGLRIEPALEVQIGAVERQSAPLGPALPHWHALRQPPRVRLLDRCHWKGHYPIARGVEAATEWLSPRGVGARRAPALPAWLGPRVGPLAMPEAEIKWRGLR